MAGFPPKKASKARGTGVGKSPKDTPAVSTGKGGLARSIRLKNQGIVESPGVEKNVNKF